ncbi:protein kinase [Aphanothece hegewaldii CCALA 016]|uniref:non-specific serine/threonine protein kinase n=1 Tax=Aphanothece hegewaldii CCALA 016 TaxID=2107694 RepID=A0A2T1LTR4_9CHRO|nr:serine/threonine-protein kinase [Aphanothece hegewaldii]PSF34252.1 protein kinase [Aphanothece hegewaldii CCALA 016]
MSVFPDFSPYNYQIKKILGKNRAGGRVTYLATHRLTHQDVVIKHYQFTEPEASWSNYRTYQNEIKVLRSFYCENIPRYLDFFEVEQGFCLVQEYKNAPSLAETRPLTPQEIKKVAIALLEVLVYLQKQIPFVIHGDIKPENILIDLSEPLKVYLIDFGFARMGSKDMSNSSVIKGTLGFIPPEEMFNRDRTKASDLYSLGVTLIVLLTQISSKNIKNLVNEKNYQLEYKHLLPSLHPDFINWLDKMTAPSVKDRFPHALAALKALENIPVTGNLTLSDRFYRGEFYSKKLATISLGSLALIGLIGFLGLKYWQGRPLQQLLNQKTCSNCELTYINLPNTDLNGVNLVQANLYGAYLRDSNLKSANLRGVNLENADLSGVNLAGANLESANLKGIKLIGANLTEANLEDAHLEDANLEGANLAKSNLKFANLINTILKDTNLEQANLTSANFGGTSLEGAILNGTTMPDGSKKP